MVAKESLRLGQKVLVGAEKKPAVIDGLLQTFAGVIVDGGGYEFHPYENIETA